MKQLVLLAALLVSACAGGNPAAPTPTTPNPTPQPAPAPIPLFSGTVVATNGGQPLAGVTVTAGGLQTVTDSAGGFRLAAQPGAMVSLTGPNLVNRSSVLQNRLEMFGPGFDLAFFRQFVRNGFEQPFNLQPIRRLTSAPNIYMRTVTDDGRSVNRETLNQVSALIQEYAGIWSGGAFGVAGITEGLESRSGQAGWLTIRWPSRADPLFAGNVCGRADVGQPGGSIWFMYDDPICVCNGSQKIYPRAVRHELGHAFGYWHTDNPTDVMSNVAPTCDRVASPREREYARYAYARPVGNRDPDSDQ